MTTAGAPFCELVAADCSQRAQKIAQNLTAEGGPGVGTVVIAPLAVLAPSYAEPFSATVVVDAAVSLLAGVPLAADRGVRFGDRGVGALRAAVAQSIEVARGFPVI